MPRITHFGWSLFLIMAGWGSSPLPAQPQVPAAVEKPAFKQPPAPAKMPLIKQPSLMELAKLYKDLDLPLPPKESFFAMVDEGASLTSAPTSKPEITYSFYFAIGGPYPKAPYGIWQGFHFAPKESLAKIFPKAPNPAAILSFLRMGRTRGSLQSDQEDYGELVFAVQCQLLEHFELANFFYRRCQKSATEPFNDTLIWVAWNFWGGELADPKRDLALVAKKLHHIVDKHRFFEILRQGPASEKEDIERNIQDHRALLERLELTLRPSGAKPGTIEALIDELLIDPHANEGWDLVPPEDKGPEEKRTRPEPGIQKRDEPKNQRDAKSELRGMGFASVPTLIEHVDDMRLIRHATSQRGLATFYRDLGRRMETVSAKSYHTVGSVVRDVLSVFFRLDQNQATKADYLKSWNEIKNMKESEFVAKQFESTEDQSTAFLIFASGKYRGACIEAYKKFLQIKPDIQYMAYLIILVTTSDLPKETKVDLLAQAAVRCPPYARFFALRDLLTLDNGVFSKVCVELLQKIPKDGLNEVEENARIHVIRMGFRSEVPSARQIFEKYTNELPFHLKLQVLNDLCGDVFQEPTGSKTLAFLSPFFKDTTLYHPGKKDHQASMILGHDLSRAEVRNLMAMCILRTLEIDILVNDNTSEETWTQIRELAKSEIARHRENQKRQ